MAIHPMVFMTPGREYRITADPAGTVFTVEQGSGNVYVFHSRVSSLKSLEGWLKLQGWSFADLAQD